jgi:hypothetical protein
MADTRTRITLGQALNRTEETDSSIAADLYVPGYRRTGARTVRESETKINSGQDIKAVVGTRLDLANRVRAEYTDKHMEGNNPYHRSEAYALANNPSGNNSETLQDSLNVMNSSFLNFSGSNPFPALESGRASTESSNFFFNEEDLKEFRQELIKQVLEDQNNFFATDNDSGSFFKPNAPNEDESFPQGMFSVQKKGKEPVFGRYIKSNRSIVKKSDIEKATKLRLQKSNDQYISISLPKIPLDGLRMQNLLNEGREAVKNLKLDGNENIYKASINNENENSSSTSFGAGNKPTDLNSFISVLDAAISVNEFNSFLQYGAMGVVLKSAIYSLASTTTVGAVYLNLLLKFKKSEEDEESAKIKNNLFTLLPPSLIRLKNELGLNGEELDIESEKFFSLDVSTRIFQGWRVLFGFYDNNDAIGFNASTFLNAFPEKISQSPQFHFTLARKILSEIQALGDPSNFAQKSLTDLSGSFLLKLTATMYKLGVKTEREIKRKEEDIVDDFLENGGYRNNRHKNFASRYRSGLKKDPFINPLSLKHFDYAAITSNAPSYINNDEYSETKLPSQSQRFTPEDVERIEKKIDADYVPFSIQDLRTNEIIALPAFIDSISDNFSVNYESTHGYGRTDPVYTYSKTERSVELSFNLVSFNPEDHNRMYEIVNHLTSMCYPQRNRGQLRVNADNQKFYQPFSQIQTASPMVRVRLGNIIHSNRSERGYRQLFGNVLGERFEDSIASAQSTLAKLNAEFKEKEARKVALEGLKNNFEIKKYTLLQEYNVICNKDCKVSVEVPRRRTRNVDLKAGAKIKVQGRVLDPGNLVITQPLQISPFRRYASEIGVEFKIKHDDVSYDNSQLSALQNEIDNLQAQINSNERITNSSADNDFLNPSKNPIVRSFQTTAGKGLACFIKSLSLDYNNSPWETDQYGGLDSDGLNFDNYKKSVAPTRIKISMSLAPIHDMPLGLSYDGTIMAPSHPVGNWSLPDVTIPSVQTEQSTD